MLVTIYNSLLVAFGIACIISDFRSKKIPNGLNVAALITLLFFYEFGINGIILKDLFAWWLISFSFWFIGIYGGGDAKMLFWLGIGIPFEYFDSLVVGLLLFSGIYVGISLLLTGQGKRAIMNIGRILTRKPYEKTKMVFSPAILISLLFQHFYGFEKFIQF